MTKFRMSCVLLLCSPAACLLEQWEDTSFISATGESGDGGPGPGPGPTSGSGDGGSSGNSDGSGDGDGDPDACVGDGDGDSDPDLNDGYFLGGEEKPPTFPPCDSVSVELQMTEPVIFVPGHETNLELTWTSTLGEFYGVYIYFTSDQSGSAPIYSYLLDLNQQGPTTGAMTAPYFIPESLCDGVTTCIHGWLHIGGLNTPGDPCMSEDIIHAEFMLVCGDCSDSSCTSNGLPVSNCVSCYPPEACETYAADCNLAFAGAWPGYNIYLALFGPNGLIWKSKSNCENKDGICMWLENVGCFQ